MARLMARRTESDQVFFGVVAQSAPPLNVMDFKVVHPPARLTSPAVTNQDSSTKLSVGFRIKRQASALPLRLAHVDSRTVSRSSILCGVGSARTNRLRAGRRAPWLLASKLTPARKSAQIISKHYPRDLSLPSISPAVSKACSITGSWLLYALK